MAAARVRSALVWADGDVQRAARVIGATPATVYRILRYDNWRLERERAEREERAAATQMSGEPIASVAEDL